MMMMITAITINTPTPTPRLNIPSTTSQLEKERRTKSITHILCILFIIFGLKRFINCLLLLFYKGLFFIQKHITLLGFLVI